MKKYFFLLSLSFFSCKKTIKKQNADAENCKKISIACDVTNQITRNFSVSLAKKYQGNFNIDQVCNVFDYLYKNWKYVNDPNGMEYYSTASNSINIGLVGDCDDFAILMYSAITAIGGEARINLAFNTDGSGHAFTEVNLGSIDPKKLRSKIDEHYKGFWDNLFGTSKVQKIFYRQDAKGVWLNLDWSNKYVGGKYFEGDMKAIVYYPSFKGFQLYERGQLVGSYVIKR